MTQKEKLEEAKRLYQTANADQKYVLESLFPELKESEDEVVRKGLLEYFQRRKSDGDEDETWYGIEYDAIILWLEKHSEKKAEWTPMDEQRVENLLAIVEGHGYPGEVAWLNSLKDRVQPKQCEQNLNKSKEHDICDTYDEKIRKALLDLFKIENFNGYVTLNGIDVDEVIAWLEKQADHVKFINSIQVGDKVTRNQDGVLVNLSQLQRVAKPAEEYNITGIGSKNAQGKLGEMIKNLKPAWSEDDERYLNNTISYLKDATEFKETAKLCIDWLKSFKYRVQPQPKQEWSEEDKNRINRLIAYFEDKESFTAEDDIVYANWLKSLRPQNRWKPSDEQMIAIQEAMNIVGILTITGSKINSLYQDLKKLKE